MSTPQNNDNRVYLYDTTLRDGAQTNGVDFTLDDKHAIAQTLDNFGITYIEGGWPGANPTDTEFFATPPAFSQAKFTAFGMTHKYGVTPADDTGFQTVLNAATHICLVGKSSRSQAENALKVPAAENLKLIAASIAAIKQQGKEALFDAEHFFDAYKEDPTYALSCLEAAITAGADWLVLCDTKGGTATHEVFAIVTAVKDKFPNANLGIHAHNDRGRAVANSEAAVRAGCRMVQGTINGLGERCGNANLITLAANLTLDGYDIGAVDLTQLTELSRFLDRKLDRDPDAYAPYVGKSAFGHKGGLHASGIKNGGASTYEHAPPEQFGNRREIYVSDQAGKSNVRDTLQNLGFQLDENDTRLNAIVDQVKTLESQGYSFDNARTSFALVALSILDPDFKPFEVATLNTWDTINFTDGKPTQDSTSNARVTVRVCGEEITKVTSGNGPVNALDNALREALRASLPELNDTHLTDYHVRIIDTAKATAATTRVRIEMLDAETGETMQTIGVAPNVHVASFMAMVEGYKWALRKRETATRPLDFRRTPEPAPQLAAA